MIVTFQRLYKIAFYGWWAFLLYYLIKIHWIVFLLICGISFLHDIFGIGKVFNHFGKLDFLIEFIRPKFTEIGLGIWKPEWADFGCSFVGFIIALMTGDAIFSGTWFIFALIFWGILNIFAILSRYNSRK